MPYAIWGSVVTIGLMFVVFAVPVELKPYVLGVQVVSLLAQITSLINFVVFRKSI